MLASVAHVVPAPGTVVGIECFGNVGLPVLSLRNGKGVQNGQIVFFADHILFVKLQNIRHRLECLRCGKWP